MADDGRKPDKVDLIVGGGVMITDLGQFFNVYFTHPLPAGFPDLIAGWVLPVVIFIIGAGVFTGKLTIRASVSPSATS
ncbi:MAG: hypothetical protein HYW93_03005 [Thaumarchaeota archaeon]|nr:hypothetical protein [Nitrososphaerota archaeon]